MQLTACLSSREDKHMLKVGILGVGVIGRTIATALDEKLVDAELVALSDQDHWRARALVSELSNHPPLVSIDEMIELCDVAIEAAGQKILPKFVPKALTCGRDMLIMSVGGDRDDLKISSFQAQPMREPQRFPLK